MVSVYGNMHVRATLRKYRVLRYLIWFLKENAANSVYLCVLRAQFSPVKCFETISPPKGFTPCYVVKTVKTEKGKF